MDKLNFSSTYYKNKAKAPRYINYQNHRTASDAFMLCIKDLPKEELDNLCQKLKEYYANTDDPIYLNLETCYALTQGENTPYLKCDKNVKHTILSVAFSLAHENKTMGSKENNHGSTTAWINHVLYHAEASSQLAKQAQLDPDTAMKLGILHDIGRKFTHTFLHTIAGFEYLQDNGWYEESFACLTHSFLSDVDQNNIRRGNRSANCEPAAKGFHVDQNGNACWTKNIEKDDIHQFLDGYLYNQYDQILNVADLMATSTGITTPYNRVTDIATRKPIDPKNRKFFLASFCNTMLEILQQSGEIEQTPNLKIKATPNISLEEMDQIFFDISNQFTDFYNKISDNKIQTPGPQYKKALVQQN